MPAASLANVPAFARAIEKRASMRVLRKAARICETVQPLRDGKYHVTGDTGDRIVDREISRCSCGGTRYKVCSHLIAALWFLVTQQPNPLTKTLQKEASIVPKIGSLTRGGSNCRPNDDWHDFLITAAEVFENERIDKKTQKKETVNALIVTIALSKSCSCGQRDEHDTLQRKFPNCSLADNSPFLPFITEMTGISKSNKTAINEYDTDSLVGMRGRCKTEIDGEYCNIIQWDRSRPSPTVSQQPATVAKQSDPPPAPVPSADDDSQHKKDLASTILRAFKLVTPMKSDPPEVRDAALQKIAYIRAACARYSRCAEPKTMLGFTADQLQAYAVHAESLTQAHRDAIVSGQPYANPPGTTDEEVEF